MNRNPPPRWMDVKDNPEERIPKKMKKPRPVHLPIKEAIQKAQDEYLCQPRSTTVDETLAFICKIMTEAWCLGSEACASLLKH